MPMWLRMGRINIRDRILYVYMYTGYIMAKLYWRYKKNGKWTWTPALILEMAECPGYYVMNISKKVDQE
jgi:hypothetical protein